MILFWEFFTFGNFEITINSEINVHLTVRYLDSFLNSLRINNNPFTTASLRFRLICFNLFSFQVISVLNVHFFKAKHVVPIYLRKTDSGCDVKLFFIEHKGTYILN